MQPYRQIFCSRSGAVVRGNSYADFFCLQNMQQLTLGALVWMLKPFPFRSSSRMAISITLRRAVDIAMY